MKKDGRINNGGSRKGAGRPKQAETTTVSFRVKVEYAELIKEAVRKLIKKLDKTFKP